MVKHKKIYLDYYGFGEQDFVPCEYTGLRAQDIHHLNFKSQGGKDEIENLIAVTRKVHERAHKDKEFNEYLRELHLKNM